MNNFDLKNSLIFNLSMCSLEDFYTCFMEWLGNQYPNDFIKVFTDEKYNNLLYKKQQKHGKNRTDLEIHSDDKILFIVENKLKSMPKEEQLKEYNNINNGKNFLLSLIDLYEKPDNWEYISYSDYAQKLASIFHSNFSYKDITHKYIVEDYINVITYISSNMPSKNLKTLEIYKILKKIPEELHDIYIKTKMAELCELIKKEVSNNYYNFDHNFSNKSGIVNINRPIEIEGLTKSYIGIQIQKYQYRYCMVINFDRNDTKKNLDNLRESIAKELEDSKLWFFDTLSVGNVKNYQNFCGYNPDFIYKYKKMESCISFEKISQNVANDIKLLDENFEKIRQKISRILSK